MEYDEEESRSPAGNWLVEHYDILQELYMLFRRQGESVFGGAFFQFALLLCPGAFRSSWKFPLILSAGACIFPQIF